MGFKMPNFGGMGGRGGNGGRSPRNTGSAGWQRKAQEWARGRNGVDECSRACANVAFVLVIVGLFTQVDLVSVVALVLLGYAWFRMASRNTVKRAQENAAFVKAAGPAVPWLLNPLAAFRELRAYKHLVCPSCGQRVRVPRGKGKVRITCPKCHTRFDGKA